MKSTLGMLSITVCLCIFGSNGLKDEDFKRALNALHLMGSKEEYKRIFDCKEIGEECTGALPCCGSTQCFWKDGYDALHVGACVECVKEGQYCQRDSQCCSELQCDKGNAGWMDGKCSRYRREGECYRDGQCVNDCKKDHWYSTHGVCE